MKWKTLKHNGILFPPAFESLGIKIKIKGEKIDLDLLQEEMVYQWAKKKDTPYSQDKIFQKNFAADFAKTLPSKFKKTHKHTHITRTTHLQHTHNTYNTHNKHNTPTKHTQHI